MNLTMMPYTEGNINYQQIALDLQMPTLQVVSYFGNSNLCYKYPIRTLTADEIEFAHTCRDLGELNDDELIGLAESYQVPLEDIRRDYLTLAKIAHPKVNYDILRRNYDWLIRPYLQYGMSKAMTMMPLTRDNIKMLLGNIAMGIGIREDEEIDVNARVKAMTTLLNQMNAEEAEHRPADLDPEVVDLTENLSPDKIRKLLGDLKKPKKVPKAPVIVDVEAKAVKKKTGTKSTKKKPG